MVLAFLQEHLVAKILIGIYQMLTEIQCFSGCFFFFFYNLIAYGIFCPLLLS